MGVFLFFLIFYCASGWLFCHINPEEHYGWLSGVWHGLYLPFNWLRSLIWDVKIHADSYTAAYQIWFWIGAVFSVVSLFLKAFLFSGKAKEEAEMD